MVAAWLARPAGTAVPVTRLPERIAKPHPRVLLLAAVLLTFACTPTSDFTITMDDSSMEPTFQARDVLRFRPAAEYTRGDVVAFEYPFPYPGRPQRVLVARIVGLPGERLELGPHRLVVDGREVAEPYAKHRERMEPLAVRVEPGHYFVLGDDRNNQRDSRWWGQLPAKKVLGRLAAPG